MMLLKKKKNMYISVLFSHCNCGPMLHLLFKTFANDSYLNAFYVRNAKSFCFLSILKKQMYLIPVITRINWGNENRSQNKKNWELEVIK